MEEIKFGTAGLGPVKDAERNLEIYKEGGLKACEIAFTYGVYIKTEEDAVRIGKKAHELGISLSIHAPYWINLNSLEKEKIQQSKERILECCRIGTFLGATNVVFHPGFYGKKSREESYNTIKESILDLEKKIKEKKYTPKLAPETMGKVNVFGSVDEILKLVQETGCNFCVDFAHVLAREGKINYEEVFRKLESYKKIHTHFSGIEYREKGERKHLNTPENKVKELLKAIPSDKEITIINESPQCFEDAVMSLNVYNDLHKHFPTVKT